MKTVRLDEYTKGLKQDEAAKRLGVSQGALSQMLSSDREIFVELINDEISRAFEIKPVGQKRKNKPSGTAGKK